jgi:putative ABC transport system permease protein
MRPRWFKVLADLWGNRTRSGLIIASITVGLFAIGVIVTIQYTLQQDMRTGFAAINPANMEMTVVRVDDALVKLVEGVDGVASAEAGRVFSMRAKDSTGEWVTIALNAFPNPKTKKISQLKLVDGKWPPRIRQVVLDAYKFDELGVRIGDTIEMELPDGNTRALQVSGVIKDQTIGSSGTGGGFFMAPAQGYITTGTLGWLGQDKSYNQLYVTVSENSDDENQIRIVADRVRKTIEKNGGIVVSQSVRASSSHPNSTYTSAISNVLLVLSGLVVFLSGFLITNTFQALLNQQVNQIGIMKTIGGRSQQIIAIYMALILVFGLLAFAVALPLANRASIRLMNFLAGEINMEIQEFKTVPTAVFVMLGLALIVPQVAGFLPILQGVRISVQEATSGIRQEGGVSRPGRLEQRLLRVRRLPRPLLVSLRNTFRRKGRLALTITTLSLGGAIFIATFNVRTSIDNYINRVGKYFLADINLTLEQPYHVREIQNLLEAMPEVSMVEGWAAARAEILRGDNLVVDSTTILAPPAGSPLVQPILLEGRWVSPGDNNAIAISERFSDALPGIHPGDMLRLRINGQETRWMVVGRFQLVGKAGGYVAYTSFENLNRVLGSANQTNTYRVVASQSGLNLEEQKALGKKIEDHLKSLGYRVKETTAGLSLNENSTTGLNVLTTFLLIMAILTALVGSIGLAGTMSLNVMERTREIGILRAIGASDGKVIQMVMVEGLLIGILSWIAGFLLSFPISKVLSDAMFMALFSASWQSSFTPAGAVIWLMVVLLLSAVASILPARSAARLTIREVLAYE